MRKKASSPSTCFPRSKSCLSYDPHYPLICSANADSSKRTLSSSLTVLPRAFRSLRRMPWKFPFISGARFCHWKTLPTASLAGLITSVMVASRTSHIYGKISLLPLLRSTRIRSGSTYPKIVNYGTIWASHRQSPKHTTLQIPQNQSMIPHPISFKVWSRQRGRSSLNLSQSDVSHSQLRIRGSNLVLSIYYHQQIPLPLPRV